MDEEFRKWLLIERLKWSLKRRFFVRFHAVLLLLGAVLAGWTVNRLLFVAGVDSMLIRHPIGVLAAYVGFLIGIELWIRYSGIREYVNYRKSKELLEPEGFRQPDRTGSEYWPIDSVPVVDGEGCLVVLLIALAIGLVFAMGGYLIVTAADLFAEIVFELLLVAGLIRGIRRIDLLGLTGGIPRITLPALAIALTVSILFGLWARHVHPQAKTIAQVVAEEVDEYRAARDARAQTRRR